MEKCYKGYLDFPQGTYLYYAEIERELVEFLIEKDAPHLEFVQLHLHSVVAQYAKYLLVSLGLPTDDEMFFCNEVSKLVEAAHVPINADDLEACRALDRLVLEYSRLPDCVSLERERSILPLGQQYSISLLACTLRGMCIEKYEDASCR